MPRAGVIALALCFLGLAVHGPSARAVSSTLVISQVYGGGGNSGATLKNDFIELFNRGTTTVDLTGWSVQYTSAAGTSWQTTPLAGSVPPGGYYLVQEAAGTGGTVDLPTPDAIGSIAMSATSGKVALVSATTALTGSGCPITAPVIDFVGYGTANCFEGSAAVAALTNTTAALRAGNGSVDTDANSADFTTGAPNPRNSGGAQDAAPSVSSTVPTANASGVATTATISVTFSEPVNVAGAWFTIACSSSGGHTATVAGGPTTFTLTPSPAFAPNDTCTVTIVAAQVTDQDTNDPPDAMAANYVWSFTVGVPPPSARIHDIQGKAHRSPLEGQTVSFVPGIVTAVRSNGFYFQDPNPDSDPATSEGVFVFTSSAPTVAAGDSVLVSGRVQEFRPGCSACDPTASAYNNLTTTEIGAPGLAVSKLSNGNPLPPPVVISVDRTPPTAVYKAGASGDIEVPATGGAFDPAASGVDFWESLEGMRLQLNSAVAVGPTNQFGELPVLAGGIAGAGPRTPRGGIIVTPSDFNPERLILDDAILPVPQANVGDQLGTVVGVLDYNFANFMLEITQPVTRTPGGIAPEVAAAPGPNELTIATFNVENLDPGDGTAKFSRLAGIIVNNLRSPDIIAVEEVQDNNGPTDNGVVDASTTYATLVAAIQAAGGPTYQVRQIDPVNDQDGGEPGGNIRVGFLFRTDRGLSFVDRPGGTSTSNTTVINNGGVPQLSASPGRIQPNDPAFTTSRKPLAGEFRYNSRTLFVIANHFNSKGGDQPLEGRFQPPAHASETQRHQQAQIVAGFVQSLRTVDANAGVVVLGDLNDFQFSDTLTILKGAGLTDMIETLPANEQYTYDFEGNSQTLDHILLTPPLAKRVPAGGYDVVHVNAEFFDQASDHDPQVVRIRLPGPQTASLGAAADTYVRDGAEDTNQGGAPFLRVRDAGNNRALVRFDQAAIQAQVGDGRLLSARLRLTITDNGNNWGPNGRTVDLHRLTVPWAEGNGFGDGVTPRRGSGVGATWACAIDSDISNQRADCSGPTAWVMGQPRHPELHPWVATPTATTTIRNGQSGVVELDVTADVLPFLAGTAPNDGWLLRKTNEDEPGRVEFGSRESGAGPRLVLTFLP